MYYYKAQGTTKYQQFLSNAGPVTSGNPAWVTQVDPTTAAYTFSTTYPNAQPSTDSYWHDFAKVYDFGKTGAFNASASVTSPLLNATTSTINSLPLQVTNTSLTGGYVGFLVGKAFAAHSSFFPLWIDAAVPYADLETYSGGDPFNINGNQYTFPGGHFSIGNTTFNGSALLTLPGMFNVGASNQFFVTSAGAATATNVTDSALTSGNCVQASTGGLLTTTAGPCGTGAGTVSSFSAGTLSPLFTTSVATSTTTPALTFSLSTAAAHTFFGNNTGSTAAPGFQSIGAADLPAALSSSTSVNGTSIPSSVTLGVTVASGTSALGTGAIASGACASAVTTTATGTATTDVIGWGFNGDPTAVTGYIPSTSGMLTIIAYPSTNNVSFKVCNNTSASITPGAITLNWRVAR
jgi:hypothetical protein